MGTPTLRQAVQQGLTVEILYQDAKGDATQRIITPLLPYQSFRDGPGVLAYCHLRYDFRLFLEPRSLVVRVCERRDIPAEIVLGYLQSVPMHIRQRMTPKPPSRRSWGNRRPFYDCP
jgi:hypothetical protein